MATRKTATTATVEVNEVISEFDPELTGEQFNAPRVPRLPYGIVINDATAGLFVPEKNLGKAGWFNIPELTELELAGGKEKGVFLTSARMLVLGAMRPYIRYRNNEELGDDKLTAIGWYDENKQILDKKTMEAVSEHLIMFLDDKSDFLHQRPIRIRFKNVALWSLRDALDECYSAAELAFAKLSKTRASGKDDRWRSLVVFNCQFKGIKEGEGANKSYCCKVISYEQPTAENLRALFLGTKEKKNAVLETFDMNVGFLLAGNPVDNGMKRIEAAQEQELPMLNGK
jgi:hypothetical protein